MACRSQHDHAPTLLCLLVASAVHMACRSDSGSVRDGSAGSAGPACGSFHVPPQRSLVSNPVPESCSFAAREAAYGMPMVRRVRAEGVMQLGQYRSDDVDLIMM